MRRASTLRSKRYRGVEFRIWISPQIRGKNRKLEAGPSSCFSTRFVQNFPTREGNYPNLFQQGKKSCQSVICHNFPDQLAHNSSESSPSNFKSDTRQFSTLTLCGQHFWLLFLCCNTEKVLIPRIFLRRWGERSNDLTFSIAALFGENLIHTKGCKAKNNYEDSAQGVAILHC